MSNCGCGNKPELERFIEHQPKCEAVQIKESDKDMPKYAAEQEAVSSHVVTQGNTFSERLESANGSSIDAALFVVLNEVKQTNMMTAETKEYSADIKNEPQDQRDLEGPIVQLHGNLDKMENEAGPNLQISQKDSSFQNLSLEHSLYLNEEETRFQQIEEPSIDPKVRDDHPERLSDAILEHVENTCVGREILLQATYEVGSLEPPAKKRLRKRMVLENDDTTLIDQEEMSGPECSENAFEVLVLETNNAALIDEGRTEEVEIINKYALIKCTALMSDKVTTDESLKENSDVSNNSILDENNGTIIMHEKGTDEPIVFLGSTGIVETPRSSTMKKKVKMIPDEPSVAPAFSYQEIEAAICSEEPNCFRVKITNIEQDNELNRELEVLSEKHHHHADDKLEENPDEIATEVEVAQNAHFSSICAAVEKTKGSVITFKEMISAVPNGLEAHKSEVEEQHSPSLAASEKHHPDRPELCLDSPYINNTSILEVASTYKTRCAKGHSENDMFMIAVSDSAVSVGGDAEDAQVISEPLAPPTGQEDHIQNTDDTTVTPTVAEQQLCNPTLTPAHTELLQKTDMSPWLYSLTDSQIHEIALCMEQEDQPVPESSVQPEDATELVRGLIRELSSLKYET
ncbi:hypothetical protein Baya_1468 [Bagarius yarrelli]|uniref:Uncharacterized protein n=1 Tax=Bagarius yarrelli TaxID=175774 RepID=A0A556TL66_BAGYA|nr:hypothetical protein Baya_1468 [Bagarius yarrelli]